MGNISNLYASVPGVKADYKHDWREDAVADWKFDWDLTAGSNPPLPAPVNTVLPAVTGTVTVGSTLTATTGTWSGAGITYTYQWERDGEFIKNATAATRVLTSRDVGSVLAMRITATNASGQVSVVSAPTAIITV